VLVSTVASFKLINREAKEIAVGNLFPGTLDNCKASVAHISAHGLDEFVVGDAAILVVIKVVVQSAKLLSGQEDSKASKHSLELELVEYLVSILIVGRKDFHKLVNAVNALGIELELELVDDLF